MRDAISTSVPRRSSIRSPSSIIRKFGRALGRSRRTSAAMASAERRGIACARIRANAAGDRENPEPQWINRWRIADELLITWRPNARR